MCVPLSRMWHGRAGHVDLCRKGDPGGPALGWDAQGISAPPARPPAFALGARSVFFREQSGLLRATFSLIPKPELVTAETRPLPGPPPRQLRLAWRPKVPRLPRARAPGTRRPAQGPHRRVPSPPGSCTEGCRGSPPPARPACGPRHSQVAATGQDEKDLRAIDGEERAARRQQEHGGPALLAGLNRPSGQGA